jgi:hypothetical protein
MARTPARLPNGTRISDHVTLGVLTTTVPAGLIDAVLADTGRQSRRQRQLPARLVVYYVMALALHAQASYGEVLRCLLEGVRWLHRRGSRPGRQVGHHQGTNPARARPAQAAVRPRGAPARRARHPRCLVSRPPAGQPGRHHHRPARHARSGGAFRPSGCRAREQRLSPAAPADADRDRHARDLRVRLRPLPDQRGCARARTVAPAGARHAVPGRPGLCRLRAVAQGNRHRRRPALAGAQEPGPALLRVPAGRLVPEPPPCLAQAPPP